MTTDEGVIMPNALMAQSLTTQLQVISKAIESVDPAIADRAQMHPDYALFEALPGAGPVLAPRLLVAFGKQRERYRSAQELQKYAGIAPVIERSGKRLRSGRRGRSDFPSGRESTMSTDATQGPRIRSWFGH